jgi:membrane protein
VKLHREPARHCLGLMDSPRARAAGVQFLQAGHIRPGRGDHLSDALRGQTAIAPAAAMDVICDDAHTRISPTAARMGADFSRSFSPRTRILDVKTIFPLLKAAFVSWNAHKAPKMGAALAYYTAFSLAPLVVLVVSLVSLAVEESAARAEIVAQFAALAGKEAGATVEAILAHSAKQDAGVWAAILGFGVLLVGASGVFAELQDSLNAIWEVPPRERRWLALLRERLVSFAMVFALGFLVLVSLLLSAGLAALGACMKGWLPGFDAVWEGTNSLVSLVVVTLLFAGLFRFLPDIKVAWRDVWTGAAITATLFVLGKFLLGLYIGRSAFASAYGAAGSLIIVLLWVYYSAQIFFFGAEFTRAFARRHGSHRHTLAETQDDA